jgi:hypothetical protein
MVAMLRLRAEVNKAFLRLMWVVAYMDATPLLSGGIGVLIGMLCAVYTVAQHRLFRGV